jgi:5-methyltetrahydropteroyltriglutamate--homocysteine methyltransferase
MKRSEGRILTTHVGSLVRTPDLVELMIRRWLGEPADPDAHDEALRVGVDAVVRRQADIGVDVVGDGELGKSNWITYISERMTGITRSDRPARPDGSIWPEQDRFGEFYRRYAEYESVQWLPETPSRDLYRGGQLEEYTRWECTGALGYDPRPLERDLANLAAALEHVDVEEAFMPVVAPCSLETCRNLHYETQDEYLFALADVLAVEYRMIVDAGFLLQVDDAILPMQRYQLFRDAPETDYRRWAELRMDALNHALAGIPEDRVRYHVCFGSQNVPHTTDPDLRDIIDLVLRADAQALAVEACNPRHEHEWQLWRDVDLPDGKILIPGVIGHATNIVEHPELIAMRLKTFAGLVGRENVMAGTDCGFSQSWNSPRVHEQVQWAKLAAMVEGARLASDELW